MYLSIVCCTTPWGYVWEDRGIDSVLNEKHALRVGNLISPRFDLLTIVN